MENRRQKWNNFYRVRKSTKIFQSNIKRNFIRRNAYVCKLQFYTIGYSLTCPLIKSSVRFIMFVCTLLYGQI